jgi:membrane-associated phospholipid phosphatase
MLLVMWTGPRPSPGSLPNPARLARRDILVDVALCAIFGLIFEGFYSEGDYLYLHAPKLYDLATSFDALLPMWRPFSIIYLSIMPLLLTAPFLLKEPRRLLPLGIAWSLELAIALAVYAAFPVRALSAPYDPSGIFGLLMQVTKGINLEGNTFPSLHVTLSVSAVWAYSAVVSRPWRIVFWTWGIAIVASTMLIRQHGIADVAGGLALASAVMVWAYPAIQRALATSEGIIFSAPSGDR